MKKYLKVIVASVLQLTILNFKGMLDKENFRVFMVVLYRYFLQPFFEEEHKCLNPCFSFI